MGILQILGFCKFLIFTHAYTCNYCFRHAKRTTINADDVKLLVRKCPNLVSRRSIGLDTVNKIFERKIVNIFLSINFNICFGCSKEPSH